MRILLFVFSFAIIGFLANRPFHSIASGTEECCGKCIGSVNCKACRNCSRCAHCTSGGSCGMCSGGSEYTPVTPSTKRHSSLTPSSTPSKSKPAPYENKDQVTPTSITAIVNVESLNVRQGPGTQYKVIGKLTKDEPVEVLEIHGKWALISTQQLEGPVFVTLEGYVFLSYLNR